MPRPNTYLSLIIMDDNNIKEWIELKGDFDPESESFELCEALFTKNGRTTDYFDLITFSNAFDDLIENTDWRGIYRQQFQYA